MGDTEVGLVLSSQDMQVQGCPQTVPQRRGSGMETLGSWCPLAPLLQKPGGLWSLFQIPLPAGSLVAPPWRRARGRQPVVELHEASRVHSWGQHVIPPISVSPSVSSQVVPQSFCLRSRTDRCFSSLDWDFRDGVFLEEVKLD